MHIRFGYVAMALNLPEGSPNRTVTYTNLMKLPDRETQLSKLRRIAAANLACQMRVLRYTAAHGIRVFRMTSKLIPLATHPIADGWDYCGEFQDELAALGAFIRSAKLRVSAHPDHFTLLNSANPAVVQNAAKALAYHDALFAAMGLGSEAKLVLHAGGAQGGKPAALSRFLAAFDALPAAIQSRVVLENDDKTFSITDLLPLCRARGIPLVADLHHHACLNGGEAFGSLWPAIVRTWNGARPKIHFSSPRDGQNPRAHADYIDPAAFCAFLRQVSEPPEGFDVMLEAKQKDKALFALLADLAQQFGPTAPDCAGIEWNPMSKGL